MGQKKRVKQTRQQTWEQATAVVSGLLPQVFSVLEAESDFISLLVKIQPDGTMLAVLKAYGSDGGPMVCFGSGYGLVGCLMGLDGSLAANKWRVDKPWQP